MENPPANRGGIFLKRVTDDDDSGAAGSRRAARAGSASAVAGIRRAGSSDGAGVPIRAASSVSSDAVGDVRSGYVEREPRSAGRSGIRPRIVRSGSADASSSRRAVVALVQAADVPAAESLSRGSVSIAASNGVSAASATSSLAGSVGSDSARASAERGDRSEDGIAAVSARASSRTDADGERISGRYRESGRRKESSGASAASASAVAGISSASAASDYDVFDFRARRSRGNLERRRPSREFVDLIIDAANRRGSHRASGCDDGRSEAGRRTEIPCVSGRAGGKGT